MANKKIIDIDIDDTKFKKFLELFNQYTEQVDAMPKAWEDLSQSMGRTQKPVVETAAATALVVDSLERAGRAQKHFADATSATTSGMHGLANAAKNVSGHIAGIVGMVTRIGGFGAIGGILSAIAGGFGIADLASSATSQSRNARGLGLSPGKVSAFELNLAPYVGSNVLASAAGAQSDLSKLGLLATLGVSPGQAQSEDAAQIALQEIASVRRAWQQTHNLNSAQAQAALQLGFTPEDIRNVGTANARDLGIRTRAAIADAGALGFSDKVGREWATLDTAMHKAGTKIESSFIDALSGLAPDLAKWADELSDFFASFNHNDVKYWVDETVKGLHKFYDFLNSDDFKNDLVVFQQSMKAIGQEVVGALRWFRLIPGATDESGASAPEPQESGPGAHRRLAQAINQIVPQNADNQVGSSPFGDGYDFTAPENKYNLPAGLLASLAMVESGGQPHGPDSPSGAQGMFQLMPANSKGLDPYNPAQASFKAAYMIRQSLDKYGNDMRKAIAAYNWGEGNLDNDIKLHGDQWEAYAPAETRGEIRKVLTLLNAKSHPTVGARMHPRKPGVSGVGADPNIAELTRAIADLRASLKVNVTVTNHTTSKVAVSANGAGQ